MASQPINPKTNNPVRPEHLPPPTTLPLRHCSHNEDDTPIDEAECLLSLLCPNKETMRNKEHYILATADPPSAEVLAQNGEPSNPKKRKRAENLHQELSQKASALRAGARSIPGVPIVYVKRSVMILEPMSAPSEQARLGVEQSKFRTGIDEALSVVGKRKRDENDEGKRPRPKKAKGPNPLSVKKPKKRDKQRPEDQGKKNKESSANENSEHNEAGPDGEAAVKTKRKRRHKSSKAAGDNNPGGEENNNHPETAGAQPAASNSNE